MSVVSPNNRLVSGTPFALSELQPVLRGLDFVDPDPDKPVAHGTPEFRRRHWLNRWTNENKGGGGFNCGERLTGAPQRTGNLFYVYVPDFPELTGSNHQRTSPLNYGEQIYPGAASVTYALQQQKCVRHDPRSNRWNDADARPCFRRRGKHCGRQ